MGVKNYIALRNRAMMTLDMKDIRAMADAAGTKLPENHEVLMAAMHKMRVAWAKCPPDKLAESIEWLAKHGYRPGIE